MNNTELNPCPVCGSKMEFVVQQYSGSNDLSSYRLRCANKKCPFNMGITTYRSSQELVEIWNKRTQEIKDNPVNHPSHYTSGKIEVIDFIEDQKLDFHLGNALKYICRAGKKDINKTTEDLEKAIWYIKRYISHGKNN